MANNNDSHLYLQPFHHPYALVFARHVYMQNAGIPMGPDLFMDEARQQDSVKQAWSCCSGDPR